MTNKKPIFALAVLGFFASSSYATALNADDTIQCAIMEAVSCQYRMGCETGGADMVNLPDFVTINIPEGEVTGKRPDGGDLATPIERVETLEGLTIIQGGEEGVGWTILVDEETGHMTVSGSRGDEGLIIFGACIQE
ncbi:MAG: hypothetical protein V3R64_03845 [Sphingomonadales bacterium]